MGLIMGLGRGHTDNQYSIMAKDTIRIHNFAPVSIGGLDARGWQCVTQGMSQTSHDRAEYVGDLQG